MAKRKTSTQPSNKQEIEKPAGNYIDAEFINKWRNAMQAHVRRLLGLGEYPTQYAVMIPPAPADLDVDTIVGRGRCSLDDAMPFTYMLRYIGTTWHPHEMWLRKLGTRLDAEIGTMDSTFHVEVDGKIVAVAIMVSRNPDELWSTGFHTFMDDSDLVLFHQLWHGLSEPLRVAMREKSELMHTIARNPDLHGIVWLNPNEQ